MSAFDQSGQVVKLQVNGPDEFLKIEIEWLARKALLAIKEGRTAEADAHIENILKMVKTGS